MRKLIFGTAIYLLISQTISAQVKILFDAGRGETAGNADWIIDTDFNNMGWGPSGGYTCTCASNESNAQRLPTPSQTGITTSTPETYWTGCLSHWAIDCVNNGYWVETLPFGTALTYGNTSNPQDLSYYTIFIVDEPNVLFTSAEKTALMNFVQNGGSLFIGADHDVSDRNGDGFDSPDIWNDFISNNGVSNNSLGFNFSLQNFSGTYTNIVNAPTDSILHGPFGNVTKVQWFNGTCMNIFPSQNASTKAVIYRNGVVQGDSAALVVYARVGCGKVAAISDSSPLEDGTGDPNDINLYDGYITDASGNHQKLLMNMVIWLAQKNCSTSIAESEESNFLSVYPNPSYNTTNLDYTNNTNEKAVLSVFNFNGQAIGVPQKSNKDSSKEQFVIETNNLPAGVYFCKITFSNNIITSRLIIVK